MQRNFGRLRDPFDQELNKLSEEIENELIEAGYMDFSGRIICISTHERKYDSI